MSLYSIKEWTRVKALGSEYVELVHNATNEEKWGPTGEQMEEVCRVFPRGAREIMDEIRHRLKHRGDAWRPCYKSLLLLDYLVRNCANAYLPQITPILPLLREISTSFYYTNSKGVDHGVSVRERARNLSNLMNDGVLLREEREKASQTKAKLARDAGAGNRVTSTGLYSGSGYGDRNTFRESPSGGSRGFPSPPRTKEQQEKYDRQVALRLQYEEERASGRSALDSFEAFEAKHMRQKQRSQRVAAQANDADEELARRLQEEEEDRARRTGGTLPSLRSDQPGATSSATPTPAPLAPEPAAPAAKENVLDDLFAAPPAPQAQPVSQGPLDPFAAPPASAQWGGHPGAPPPQQGWGQPAQAAPTSWDQAPAQSWGQPAATAPPPHDAWQTAPQPPAQQPWGQPAAAAPPAPGAWQSAPQPPAPQSWGQPAAVPPPAHDAWQSAPQPPAPQQWGQAPTGPSPWGAPQTNGAAHGSQGYPQGDLFSAPPPAQPTTAPTNDMWASMEQFTAQQQRKRP